MMLSTRAVTWRRLLLVALVPAAACASEAPDATEDENIAAVATPVCATVKEGKRLTLFCPPGETITKVTFANYGTSTGTCGSFQPAECRAANSRSVVETACIGKNVCAVEVNRATFGDPCVGTAKTLSAEATCSGSTPPPPASGTAVCASAKEGKSLTLSCPAGQKIAGIAFANYGTTSGTCGDYEAGTCKAANSRSVVESNCVGKSTCAIDVGKATFGDPCVGTLKTLTAEATCSTSTPPVTDGGTPPPPTGGTILWRDNFDSAANGRLDKTRGDLAFGPTVAGTGAGTFSRGSIVDDGANGKFLRHSIPAGQLGDFIVSPRLSRETDHATLEYDIRFDANFDWRWGGKMGPGLVGVAPGQTIYKPTSGNPDRNVGFSTRLMWHGRGDDGSRPFQGKLGPIPADRQNDIVTYIYARYPNEGFSGFGWHTSLGELVRGEWHHVKMEVELNTVGQRNGVYRVWLDGTLEYGATDFDYRSSNDVRIQAVLYDVHRGGGTTPPSWVSSRDCQVDIRNVVATDLAR